MESNVTQEQQQSSGRVKFDPTINLGHVITFVGFVISIFIAWNTLDRRVAVLEASAVAQAQRDKFQDSRLQESISTVRTSQNRIENKLDALLLQSVSDSRSQGGKR